MNDDSIIVLNAAIHLTEDQAAQLKPPALTMRIAPAAGEKDAISTTGRIVKQRFSVASNQRVVLNFQPEVLVDREHLSEIGDDTTAYGWITGLESREDGLYATMNATDIGWEALRNRRLRFPSAVFELDKDGAPVRLKSCALTNKHNLKMLGPVLNREPARATAAAPLAVEAASAIPTPKEGEQMDKALLEALGLAETADAPAVLNKVKELVAQVTTLQTELKDIKTAALNKEAEDFVKANAAKIKDPVAVKAQYVLNKDVTVALFGAMAEPASAHQVLNRDQAQAPDAQTVLNADTVKAKAREDAIDAAAKKYSCESRARAWEMAARDNPDLFKQ